MGSTKAARGAYAAAVLGSVLVFIFASGVAQQLMGSVAGSASPEPQTAAQPAVTTFTGSSGQQSSQLMRRLAAVQDEIASSQADLDQSATDSKSTTR